MAGGGSAKSSASPDSRKRATGKARKSARQLQVSAGLLFDVFPTLRTRQHALGQATRGGTGESARANAPRRRAQEDARKRVEHSGTRNLFSLFAIRSSSKSSARNRVPRNSPRVLPGMEIAMEKAAKEKAHAQLTLCPFRACWRKSHRTR